MNRFEIVNVFPVNGQRYIVCDTAEGWREVCSTERLHDAIYITMALNQYETEE